MIIDSILNRGVFMEKVYSHIYEKIDTIYKNSIANKSQFMNFNTCKFMDFLSFIFTGNQRDNESLSIKEIILNKTIRLLRCKRRLKEIKSYYKPLKIPVGPYRKKIKRSMLHFIDKVSYKFCEAYYREILKDEQRFKDYPLICTTEFREFIVGNFLRTNISRVSSHNLATPHIIERISAIVKRELNYHGEMIYAREI